MDPALLTPTSGFVSSVCDDDVVSMRGESSGRSATIIVAFSCCRLLLMYSRCQKYESSHPPFSTTMIEHDGKTN
jgi:hypothetical protein